MRFKLFTALFIGGSVTFTEYKNYVKVEVDLVGVPEGIRGFHIHEKGNLTEGCLISLFSF